MSNKSTSPRWVFNYHRRRIGIGLSMPIMFNSILEAAGIAPADVRLLRHKDKRAKPGRTPYDLWRDPELRPMFEDYQSTQNPRRRPGLSSAKYWASFVATPDGQTLFVGLYSSRYIGLGDRERPWPIDPERIEKPNEYDVYALALQNELGDLSGKLVIE
jgi:hypothetical protein